MNQDTPDSSQKRKTVSKAVEKLFFFRDHFTCQQSQILGSNISASVEFRNEMGNLRLPSHFSPPLLFLSPLTLGFSFYSSSCVWTFFRREKSIQDLSLDFVIVRERQREKEQDQERERKRVQIILSTSFCQLCIDLFTNKSMRVGARSFP